METVTNNKGDLRKLSQFQAQGQEMMISLSKARRMTIASLFES